MLSEKSPYFWPIYGERDEVCFTHSSSRCGQHVRDVLGLSPPENGVLLSDGYAVYASYTRQVGLTHAQCWAHATSRSSTSLCCTPRKSISDSTT